MHQMTLQSSMEKAKEKEKDGIHVHSTIVKQIDEHSHTIGVLAAQNKARVFALEKLDAASCEKGEIPPSEFLKRFRVYLDDLSSIDAADTSMNDDEREKQKKARETLYAETSQAVEQSLKTQPEHMPPDKVRATDPSISDAELWKLYTTQEKTRIVQSISDAAGLDELKLAMHDDIEGINTWLREKNVSDRILKMQRAVIESNDTNEQPDFQREAKEIIATSDNPVAALHALVTKFNNTLGIEWLTFYEWKTAFSEVIESIKEVRKRKSIGRITRAALSIGRVAALLPGTGGQDLLNVLEEQQQKKNDEIKDDFKKELGDARKDYGFKDMFGDGAGNSGLLKTYISLHDTNRTRAIVEFAASKGMLFDIDSKSWQEYVLPGGIPFRDAMPAEWNDTQIGSYFENQQYANRQGADSAMKAGEALVKGRNTFNGYTDVFKGAVNGMHLWFAKGVANEALKKVKNGEMSATLTLIVLEAWESNALFRQYVPSEWLDRLSGDHKQMFVGMLKYDHKHLIAGARDPMNTGATITHDLAKANENERDPNKPQPRLGPLVVAIRNYLINKDPSLRNEDSKLMEYTAKVMASQTVELSNGVFASIYSPELAPYQIKYDPNEMRGANVQLMGDDHFIERSEITHGTVEVMKAVGAVGQDGFAHSEKARYYFSHIIDNYEELLARAKQQKTKGGTRALQNAKELESAAEKFREFISPQLNEWVKEALAGNGGVKLTNVQHKKQDGRYLLATLVRDNLITPSVIEQMSTEGNKAAKKLMESLRG